MSAVIPFGFDDNLVRVVHNDDGEPLFVAKDIAISLGYSWNGSACVAHVPEEWRGVRTVLTPSGSQTVATLTEQGLYFFLGRSDKPKALPFQKWIAGEVLPSIRKRGAYAVGGSAQPERPALPAVPILTDAALGLRPNVRAQVLSCAVQAAKMEGGSPELIDHYFQKYSEMVGARATSLPVALTGSYAESARTNMLVHAWIESCGMHVPPSRSRKFKVQSRPFYEEFVRWCRLRGEADIPGHKTWSLEMKNIFPSQRSNFVYFYVARSGRSESATFEHRKPERNQHHC
ncbi:MAG: Bro-N domain-containing protein [Halodesulfovibrio sp.]